MLTIFLDDAQMSWPPQDPASHRYGPHIDDADDDDEMEEQSGTGFELPSSPWTYDTGSLNPDLEPSNARRRATEQQLRSRHKPKRNGVNQGAIANVPPYHPDYVEPSHSSKSGSTFGFVEFGNDDDYGSGSDSDVQHYSGHRVRQGSEGYEIKPINREEILRRYIASRGEEAGRYQRYVPEPASDSESSEDKEELDPDADVVVAGAP